VERKRKKKRKKQDKGVVCRRTLAAKRLSVKGGRAQKSKKRKVPSSGGRGALLGHSLIEGNMGTGGRSTSKKRCGDRGERDESAPFLAPARAKKQREEIDNTRIKTLNGNKVRGTKKSITGLRRKEQRGTSQSPGGRMGTEKVSDCKHSGRNYSRSPSK